MFDHISIGVRDLARAKRFYDAVLRPLGYTCVSEDASDWDMDRTRSPSGSARPCGRWHQTLIQIFISASRRPHVRPWTTSIALRSASEALTTVRPAYARPMALIIMPPSRSIPTGIASRLI